MLDCPRHFLPPSMHIYYVLVPGFRPKAKFFLVQKGHFVQYEKRKPKQTKECYLSLIKLSFLNHKPVNHHFISRKDYDYFNIETKRN